MPNCYTCKFAILDTAGDGSGICQCKKYNEYKDRVTDPYKLGLALIKLDNPPTQEYFWACGNRECEKYEPR